MEPWVFKAPKGSLENPERRGQKVIQAIPVLKENPERRVPQVLQARRDLKVLKGIRLHTRTSRTNSWRR